MERVLFASVVLGLVGCVEQGQPDPSTCDVVPKRTSDSSTDDVVAGVNGFGNTLYGQLASAAQAAFIRADLTLQDAFASQILTDYGAAPQALEAEDPVGQVNGWVNDETQGHIPALLAQGQITPDIALVLVNAVYFRGDWAQPFDPQWTA